MTVLKEYAKALPLINPWIDSWKEEGKKVLGYFCSYIPTEIIHAAGILPFRVRATGCTDTPMGDAYMSPTTCSFTRCCLELAHRKEYEFLDGIVSYNSCDQVRRLYDNIRYKAPFSFHHFLSIPGHISDTTLDWFSHELFKFKKSLEKSFNVNITDDELRRAIASYNISRSLLKEIQMLRNKESPPISGTEMLKTIVAGVSIPVEQFNELLTQQLKELKDREGDSNHRARIMIIGSMLDDPEFVKIIEDQGGLVVTDNLCFGTKYYWDNVDETINPMEALAKRYLSKTSCPRMTEKHPSRAEHVMSLIKEFNVDGVIFQRIKFCAVWWAEIFMLRDRLKEEGIPFLDLEREYVLSGTGAMKTRVQGFMEILEERG